MPKPHLLSAALLISLSGQVAAASNNTFPATFELSSLDGTNGFVINGIDMSDFSGLPVSSAGDVNGDGVDDIVIGAPRADPNGIVSAGESYVVFGSADVGATGPIELSSLDGSNGFVLKGIDEADVAGVSVSSAGDVNGDGIEDLIIGAYFANPNGKPNAGESYVVFGALNVGATGVIELSTLNGTNGFVLNGIDANDQSGRSVSSAGDVNGDGVDDLIIGADDADTNGILDTGESYVIFGDIGIGATGSIELSSLNGTNGFVISPDDTGAQRLIHSGRSVSSAGDVNGDGFDDVIIGAYNGIANYGYRLTGQTYVVFGGVGVGAAGSIEVPSLDGTNGFVINGIDRYDRSGISVSSAGDVNGDGFDDLIIGSDEADPNGNLSAGESYVLFGGTGVGAFGVRTLAGLNGTNGFVINGVDAYDFSGRSVSSAGDVNGDGIDDLIIGARGGDPNGKTAAGESFVVYGSVGLGAAGSIELSSLDGSNGFVLNGIDAYDRSGWSVSSAGDVNGDGVDDIIVGAPSADPNGISSAGESYVVFGRDLAAGTCPTDVDNNGTTDIEDLLLVLRAFGSNADGDTDGDNDTDIEDLLAVLRAFGQACQ